MVNAPFTIMATCALMAVMMMTALALFAVPPSLSAAPEPAPTRTSVSARGRASVKIVRPARIRAGREDDAAGAQWRNARITDRSGRPQTARLLEFE